jgi:hypothetical protein
MYMNKKIFFLFSFFTVYILSAMESQQSVQVPQTAGQSYFIPKIEQSIFSIDHLFKKALDAACQEEPCEIVQRYLNAVCIELDVLHGYIKIFDWYQKEFSIAFAELKKFLVLRPDMPLIGRVEQLIVALELKNMLCAVCDQSDEKIEYFRRKMKLEKFIQDSSKKMNILQQQFDIACGEYKQQREQLQNNNPFSWYYPEYVLPVLSFGLIRMSDHDVEKYKQSVVEKERQRVEENIREVEALYHQKSELRKLKNSFRLYALENNLFQASQYFDWDKRTICSSLFKERAYDGIKKFVQACESIGLDRKMKHFGDTLDEYNPIKAMKSQIGNVIALVRDGISVSEQSVQVLKESLHAYHPRIDSLVNQIITEVKDNAANVNHLDTLFNIADYCGIHQTITREYAISLIAQSLDVIVSSERLKEAVIAAATLINKGNEVQTLLAQIDEKKRESEQWGLSLGQRYVHTIRLLEKDRLGTLLRVFLAMVHNQPEMMRTMIGDKLHAVLSRIITATVGVQQAINVCKSSCDQFVTSNMAGSITVTDAIVCLQCIADTNKAVAHKGIAVASTLSKYGISDFLAFVSKVSEMRSFNNLLHKQKEFLEVSREKYELYKKEYDSSWSLHQSNAINNSLKDTLLALQTELYENNTDDMRRSYLRQQIEKIQQRLQRNDESAQNRSEALRLKYLNAEKKYKQKEQLYQALLVKKQSLV